MKSIQMVAEIGAVGLLMLLVVITGCQTTGSWITEVEDEMGLPWKMASWLNRGVKSMATRYIGTPSIMVECESASSITAPL